MHVMCYACVDRLRTRAAYICRIHRSLQVSCYHGVARNWGAALPRCRCMPVCGVSVLFRLNIYFGGIARLEHQISPTRMLPIGLAVSLLLSVAGLGLCTAEEAQ